jgi:hypothetical protein
MPRVWEVWPGKHEFWCDGRYVLGPREERGGAVLVLRRERHTASPPLHIPLDGGCHQPNAANWLDNRPIPAPALNRSAALHLTCGAVRSLSLSPTSGLALAVTSEGGLV